MSFSFKSSLSSLESSRIFKAGEIGDVKKLAYELTDIEWRIADFFSLADSMGYFSYYSPAFSVENGMCTLRLFPDVSWNADPESICVELWSKETKRECPIEYNLGLKKTDGSRELIISGILEKNSLNTDKLKLPLVSEIRRRKFELAPFNILTITCTLKPEIVPKLHPNQPVVLDKTKPLQLIRLDKLSQNFKDLFGDKQTCDAVLKVRNKEYKVHKSVLIARSSVFATNFRHDALEKKTGIITIEDCDPDSFQAFLEYLYCGKLEEISFRSALNLYYISDKYGMEELRAFCVEYLMQCLTVDNICEAVIFADKYDENDLLSTAQSFFNEHANEIFENSEWVCLMKNHCRLANKLLLDMSKLKLKV